VDIVLFLLFATAGALLGTFTGLTPGIHVNNIAILAVYLYSTGMDPMCLSALVVGAMVAHTFFDFIPSTYLGAPESDTALSVLPMHRFLLEGRAYRGIYLSTVGSALSMLFSLPVVVAYFLLFSVISYTSFQYVVPLILVALIFYMFYMESRKSLKRMLYAGYVFLVAGVFGMIIMRMPQNYNFVPVNIGTSLLFPVFTGLFGIPVLLSSLNSKIPEQKLERITVKKEHLKSSLFGTLCGSLVGFLPGVSSGIATVLSRAFFKEDSENYVVALGSVNTANALLNLAALFIIAHPRSEAVGVIGSMITLPPPVSGHISDIFFLLLGAAFISAAYSFPVTLMAARMFGRILSMGRMRYGQISRGILVALLIMVLLLTGPLGLAVVAVATLIGMLPPRLGVMRVHLMAVIIVPVLLFYIT